MFQSSTYGGGKVVTLSKAEFQSWASWRSRKSKDVFKFCSDEKMLEWEFYALELASILFLYFFVLVLYVLLLIAVGA